jgi:hypothetical protein
VNRPFGPWFADGRYADKLRRHFDRSHDWLMAAERQTARTSETNIYVDCAIPERRLKAFETLAPRPIAEVHNGVSTVRPTALRSAALPLISISAGKASGYVSVLKTWLKLILSGLRRGWIVRYGESHEGKAAKKPFQFARGGIDVFSGHAGDGANGFLATRSGKKKNSLESMAASAVSRSM